MKKYILMTVGFTQPTPEIMSDWMNWFESIGDKMESQVGLMNGKEVTPGNVTDLQMDESAITGYVVISAENMEEAVAIAKVCPMITSTLVYEMRQQGA